MSASGDLQLATITKQLTIYFGTVVLTAGVIGALLNIIVFLSLKIFRRNSSAFFLTIMSFVNIGQLLTGLLSRIMIGGWDLDFTESSSAYCKFRYYCLQVCGLTSYSCMCLATIDQFLATSLRLQWRQFITIRRAHILFILCLFTWLVHGIPCFIFFNPILSPKTGIVGCSVTNSIYQQYYTYCYLLILTGALPICITVVFGCLAYRNVRQIPYRTVPLVRRELDKQLTSMVLVQVVHNFIVIVPYISSLGGIYLGNPPVQSPYYIPIVYSIRITGLFYYLYFAVSYMKRRLSMRFLSWLFRVHFIFMSVYQNDFVNNYIMSLLERLQKVDDHQQ